MSDATNAPPQDGAADAAPKKKGPNRTRTGTSFVRWDMADREILTAAAERSGLSVAGFFREAGLAAARGTPGVRASRRAPHAERVELARMLGLLGNVASNTNQLARAYNAREEFPELAELTAIRENIVILRRALMQALGRGPG